MPAHDDLPHGCISADDLHALANTLERLYKWHRSLSGRERDRPCLRRIGSDGDSILAHVSIGPEIGGYWETLELTPRGWRLRMSVVEG